MANTITANGLFRADRALSALAQDPERLRHARGRFSESPPSYRSQPSGSATRSQSSNAPSEDARRREQRPLQLEREHDAPDPYHQYLAQTHEEEDRIVEAVRNRTRRIPPPVNLQARADMNVRKRWVEQGIWKDRWKETMVGARWKHEAPLELGSRSDSESESDSQANSERGPQASPFAHPRPSTVQKQRRPKSDRKQRRTAERLALRMRDHEASRPFYQFVYQVSKERE